MKGHVPIRELALLHLYHPCNYVLMRMAASPLWCSPDYTAKPHRLTPPSQTKSMHTGVRTMAYFSCTSTVAFPGPGGGGDNMKPKFSSHRFMPRLILPMPAGACLNTPFPMCPAVVHPSHSGGTQGTLPVRTTSCHGRLRATVKSHRHKRRLGNPSAQRSLLFTPALGFDVDMYLGQVVEALVPKQTVSIRSVD